MVPRFVDIEAFTLVGLQVDTTMEGNKNLEDRPKVRQDLIDRKMEIPRIQNTTTLYGACWSKDPSDLHRFTYMAGYKLTPDSDTPAGMAKVTIPRGRYAVFTHRGEEKAINKTWEEILKSALSSEYSYDKNGIMFESFDERFTMGDDSEHDIYIPLATT